MHIRIDHAIMQTTSSKSVFTRNAIDIFRIKIKQTIGIYFSTNKPESMFLTLLIMLSNILDLSNRLKLSKPMK